ncbi:MAG: DUF6273 domain-containing protein, partial [Lachnospiraceae bacterium]|nr:DUF6273 domain-containing protein [Lachnospiraceae bacterium]
LLSVDEVISHYSFNSWNDRYGHSQELIITPTAYAKQRGAYSYVIDEDFYNGHDLASQNYSRDCIGRESAWWWLRSPNGISIRACFVYDDGRAGWDFSYLVDSYDVGLRPALYIEQ